MGFLDQFSRHFSNEEQQTELYKLWSAIGVNTEKAVTEEFTSIRKSMTDINFFSEDLLRSWLAFFLVAVPYRTSATINISVYNGTGSTVTIEPGSELRGSNGMIYFTANTQNISLSDAQSTTVQAIQGTKSTSDYMTYNSVLKLAASGPDLSYLTVSMNDTPVPKVSFQQSYTQMSFKGNWNPTVDQYGTSGGTPSLKNGWGTKGSVYVVSADGINNMDGVSHTGTPLPSQNVSYKKGDVIAYDGYIWQKLNDAGSINWYYNGTDYIIPYDGYFAFYYGGHLYIKIYPGATVPNPEGQSITVSWVESDGIKGTMTSSETIAFTDTTLSQLQITHSGSSAGADEPSRGKLGMFLKERIYCNNKLSSAQEYYDWLMAQPEIGDCIVLTDWEKYIASDRTQYNITGYIDVYAVSPSGMDVVMGSGAAQALLDRIEPYKDIGLVRFRSFTPVENYVELRFSSSQNDPLFSAFAMNKVMDYYDVGFLSGSTQSLFKSLELTQVLEDILNESPYDSDGLTIKGYHCYTFNYSIGATVSGYDGEEIGEGFYKYVRNEDNDVHTLTEYRQPDGTAILVDEAGNTAGTRSAQNIVTFTANLGTNVVMKCFWGMVNEGYLAIGDSKGKRVLSKVYAALVTDNTEPFTKAEF